MERLRLERFSAVEFSLGSMVVDSKQGESGG